MDELPEANMEVPEGMNSSVCTGGKRHFISPDGIMVSITSFKSY